MPNYNVTNNIDTLLRSTSNAAARTSLELGDAATKNTGTTAGTVAAGNDSRITGALQTSGGTMTGKLTAAADNTIAKLSVGARTTGSSPTTLADGDIWISNQGALSYRDSTGPTSRAVASLSLKQIFNAPQTVSGTMNADPALTVSNTGTREVVTISNTATATSDAVVITNLGSGNSLVVNDETTPDSTRFAVANNGRVGIGVAPDALVALSVDASGIKFSDGSVQTTASGGGVAGVSSFSAGTTGLSPATGTTGAVTLGGTLGVANGGTGQTTANAAINALLPSQTGNSGKILSTDGTNTSWATAFKFSNTKIVGVDAATIQGCIDLVSSPTALTQVQVLIPPGVYNENLTLKPCVSLASTGLNNGQSSIVRINGTHTLTGGTIAGDNIIQLNGLRMDYNASTSPTLTISATGTTPLLVHMQDCMIGNSNASTSSVGVLVNQYCSLRCNNVKSLANSTSGSGGTHIEVNAGMFYGDQFSTEYGTLALRLSGTGGALKPYAELKQCSLSCTGSNVVDITSTTALFSAGWTGFTNNATTGNGINIAAGSVIGVFNSVFVITAGASNYVVTGGAGGVYYSLNNSYSNSTGVPYETKVNANISQFLYSSSTPNAINALTGDVTASGTGSQAASVVRIQGRNVSSTAPTSGQVLAWNGTAWTPTAASGSGTVTSVDVYGGTTGLTTSGGPITSSGTITLAGTLALANGGTGATTQSGAANAVLPSQASNSGKFLTTDGSNVSWATAGGGGGGTPVDRQVFTSSGTWTKPVGAKFVQITAISSGSSGGPGFKKIGGTATVAYGGSGGASGGRQITTMPADNLPSQISVSIPATTQRYYPSYLANGYGINSTGTSATTFALNAIFGLPPSASGMGGLSPFNSSAAGGTSTGYDSNPGLIPLSNFNASTNTGKVAAGGSGAGAVIPSTILASPSLIGPTLNSVTTNFVSQPEAACMAGTGSFGDRMSSGGGGGIEGSLSTGLNGSGSNGGSWYPPVNLTNVSTTNGQKTVTCTSTAGLVVGMGIGNCPAISSPASSVALNTVSSIENATTFSLSQNATQTTTNQTALATCGYGGGGGGGGVTNASTPILITGISLTSGSTTVNCASTLGVIVGLTIFNNANIPNGTTVASLVSDTQFTISAAATGNETGGKLVVAGVGTVSGFSTTVNSKAATVSSTLGLTWGQALWASTGITPTVGDTGYRHVEAVSSTTAFTLSTSASATISNQTLTAMNCIGFLSGASTTSGSPVVTVSDVTPLYVGMAVSIVGSGTWSTTSGSTTATASTAFTSNLSNVGFLGDGVSATSPATGSAVAGSTSITLSLAAIATVLNKPFYYTCPTDTLVFPTVISSKSRLSYAKIVSINSGTNQITLDQNALATVSNQSLAYAFVGGAGGCGGSAAVEVVTYF